jgi:hypothetical protein
MKFKAVTYFTRSFHLNHLSFNPTISSKEKGKSNWMLILVLSCKIYFFKMTIPIYNNLQDSAQCKYYSKKASQLSFFFLM